MEGKLSGGQRAVLIPTRSRFSLSPCLLPSCLQFLHRFVSTNHYEYKMPQIRRLKFLPPTFPLVYVTPVLCHFWARKVTLLTFFLPPCQSPCHGTRASISHAAHLHGTAADADKPVNEKTAGFFFFRNFFAVARFHTGLQIRTSCSNLQHCQHS